MPYSDPEKQREHQRQWYIKNRERHLARGKEWSQNNRQKCVERTQRHLSKEPMRRYGYHIKSAYGITLDEYNTMLAAQDGKCAICETRAEDARNGRLVVDHMHCSGRVRSLLCQKCNTAIGMLQEDPDIIYAAACYVRKHMAH